MCFHQRKSAKLMCRNSPTGGKREVGLIWTWHQMYLRCTHCCLHNMKSPTVAITPVCGPAGFVLWFTCIPINVMTLTTCDYTLCILEADCVLSYCTFFFRDVPAANRKFMPSCSHEPKKKKKVDLKDFRSWFKAGANIWFTSQRFDQENSLLG